MDILLRNQDIVARAVNRETFAAIGLIHRLTRERVRQIFDKLATKEQKKIANSAARVTEKEKPEVATDLPRGAPKVRLHVLLPAATFLSERAIRDGIRLWLRGNLKIEISERQPMTSRLDLPLPADMDEKLRNKCDKVGLKVSPAIRAIIVATEKIPK